MLNAHHKRFLRSSRCLKMEAGGFSTSPNSHASYRQASQSHSRSSDNSSTPPALRGSSCNSDAGLPSSLFQQLTAINQLLANHETVRVDQITSLLTVGTVRILVASSRQKGFLSIRLDAFVQYKNVSRLSAIPVSMYTLPSPNRPLDLAKPHTPKTFHYNSNRPNPSLDFNNP